jgi:VanZ family protein
VKKFAAGIAWLEGAAISAVLVFVTLGVFSRIERQMWMIFGLALVLGFIVRLWPNVGPGVHWSLTAFCMTAYVAVVGRSWTVGSDQTTLSTTLRTLSERVQYFAVAICAAVGIALLVMAFKSRKTKPWASGWLLGVLLCSGMVALFSGSQGAPGGSASWLAQWLHIDQAAADMIVHYARKTGHFAFYGCFAWFGLRASQFAGAGLRLAVFSAFAIALSHACIDEWRQWWSVGRSGTPWDVLLDLAGMAAFVYLATRGAAKVRTADA